MIIPNLIYGGAECRMLTTTAGLIRRDYDVQILAFDQLDRETCGIEGDVARLGIMLRFCNDFRAGHGDHWSYVSEQAILRTDVSMLPRWITDKLGAVARSILHYRPMIVHAWLDGPAVIGGLAACALGSPRLILDQGSLSARHYSNKGELLLTAYRHVASNPNTVMRNNSMAGAADYTRWLRSGMRTILIRHNGLMPDRLRTPSKYEIDQFRAKHGIPFDAPVVGALIRFAEEKDPDLWLDTAATINKAKPDVRFLLAGQGKLYDRSVERAAALGIADWVSFLPPMSDVGLAYAAMDVILLTSRIEGLPNILIEAQAAGRPVVTPDVGGAAEALDNCRTGIVVYRRSSETLAEAVLKIISEDHWRTRVRNEGPRFVSERFGLERMIQQTIEDYGSGRAE
jgi:glycosyltransferase involved in cell wall biosynthesis